MIITLYADASYAKGIGGGAYWAKADGATDCGMFPIFDSKDSGEAETVTVLHAALLTLEGPQFALIRYNALLVIVCDCMSVKHYMEGERRIYDRNPTIKSLRARLDAMTARLGIRVKVNHVKAHTGRKDRRSWVNDWCDRNAKAARLSAIHGVKQFDNNHEERSRRKPNGRI